MARLGDVYIGGNEIPRGTSEHFSSGVVFSLENKSEIDQVMQSNDSKWQIEIKKGYSSIIARFRDPQNYDDIVKYGYEQVQRFLDLLAVKKFGIFNIKSPRTNNISVYQDETGQFILRHFSIEPLNITAGFTFEVRDKDGNLKPPPPIPEPKWTEAFRYYRLSQDSQNIFEAYRNLFLSLEAILNEICPRNPREPEGGWLKRALSILSTKVDYSHHVPSGTGQPVDYLFRTQYVDIRCRLFHAKFPYALLPQSDLNQTDISTAYDDLIRLWQDIAEKYFGVPSKGGVVTYQGFKWMMDNAFSKSLSLCFTEDDSPAKSEDTVVSPLGKGVFFFSEAVYLSQIQPGLVSWQGRLSPLDSYKDKKIHRICTLLDKTLINVALIDEGVTPAGVNIFETYQGATLVNTSQPKTRF